MRFCGLIPDKAAGLGFAYVVDQGRTETNEVGAIGVAHDGIDDTSGIKEVIIVDLVFQGRNPRVISLSFQ